MSSAITKIRLDQLVQMKGNMRSRKQRKTRKSEQDFIFPDNSLSAEEKALEYKEIAKNTNRLLKYVRSWRDNVASYIQGLESFFDDYEDLSDEQKLHIDKRNEAKFDECIQKAKDLELEDDMEMEEQIPLKTFLLKLKNFFNGFVSLSPSMVALAETMDKVLEEGVTKKGVIVDDGKLGITAKQVIECLKFAKSTSELIPEFCADPDGVPINIMTLFFYLEICCYLKAIAMLLK